MAYSEVGTPRFFCNVLEWGALNGIIQIDDLFRTLPVIPKIRDANYVLAFENMFPQIENTFNDDTSDGTGCAMFVLGHKFTTVENSFIDTAGFSEETSATINVNYSTDFVGVQDGWSVTSLVHEPTDVLSFTISDDTPLGSLILSSYYTLKHSPDMNLSLSYDHSGIKEITTRGGASLSNSFYSKPPMWGNTLAAWELGDGSEHQELSRIGRKIWDLSFSFLAQEDTFPKYDQLNTLASDPLASDPNQYTLQGSNDFYTQVLRKTQGGQLPFIFQPDKDENSFSICKFDKSSIKFTQQSFQKYSFKARIREVW